MTALQFVFRSHEKALHSLVKGLLLPGGKDVSLWEARGLSLCCCHCCNHWLSLLQLEVRISQNEAVCEGLRAQIRELWDRLQIPAEEREAVATVMTGSKAKVRKAVRNPKGSGSAFWCQV